MAILTEEQIMLRDSARDWVREKAPVVRVSGAARQWECRMDSIAPHGERCANSAGLE